MFSTFKSRLLLGVYIFLILSIPIGSYLASEPQIFKSKASESTTKNTLTDKIASRSATTSASKSLLEDSKASVLDNSTTDTSSSDTTAESLPTVATSFGPTLSLKVALEGRPANNQSAKLFVGIVEGVLSANPKFLLSFTLDLPKNGSYDNLSLAGLTVGNQYTALLKGEAQIATSSAFIMAASVTNLNKGETLNMISGDLNDDNAVTSADFDIVQKALGANSLSQNWNELADLNKDGVINTFDLSIVKRNISRTGASDTWISPTPTNATSLSPTGTNNAVGGYNQEDLPARLAESSKRANKQGYWMWIPK